MARRRRRRKKFSWYLIWGFVFFLFSSLALFSLSLLPVFQITNVKVIGIRLLDDSQIHKFADEAIGENIFFFNFSPLEDGIATLSIVKKVNIFRTLPNNLIVEVVERKEAAVAVIEEETRVFDDEGYVLDIRGNNASFSSLPILVGISSADFENNKLKADVRELLAVLLKDIKKKLPAEKIKIDLEAADRIILLVDDSINVKLGDADKIEAKLRAFQSIRDFEQEKLQSIDYIDVSVPDDPVVKFKVS
ncbi:MAG: FtsQ-type POTRA domain-containing protein [Elusimicrobiota bacterium]